VLRAGREGLPQRRGQAWPVQASSGAAGAGARLGAAKVVRVEAVLHFDRHHAPCARPRARHSAACRIVHGSDEGRGQGRAGLQLPDARVCNLPGAALVLAGVASALGPTERALPAMAALGARPALLPFPAYDMLAFHIPRSLGQDRACPKEQVGEGHSVSARTACARARQALCLHAHDSQQQRGQEREQPHPRGWARG